MCVAAWTQVLFGRTGEDGAGHPCFVAGVVEEAADPVAQELA
jgi:hypothetical protein